MINRHQIWHRPSCSPFQAMSHLGIERGRGTGAGDSPVQSVENPHAGPDTRRQIDCRTPGCRYILWGNRGRAENTCFSRFQDDWVQNRWIWILVNVQPVILDSLVCAKTFVFVVRKAAASLNRPVFLGQAWRTSSGKLMPEGQGPCVSGTDDETAVERQPRIIRIPQGDDGSVKNRRTIISVPHPQSWRNGKRSFAPWPSGA